MSAREGARKMDIFADYHIHTSASDGRGNVADKFACAAARGLSEIAIADHGPASIIFHQNERKFAAQREDILRASAAGSVRVLGSVEANILSEEGDLDVPRDMIERCDVLHMGFHRLISLSYVRRSPRYFLVNGWAARSAREDEELVDFNTRAVIAAMRRYPVDVLCHPCHRALLDMRRVCAAAAELGVYIELNEKHIDALEDSAEIALSSGAMFILGSDAHTTDKVGLFPRVEEFVKRHSVPEERICGAGAKPVFRDKRGGER